MAFLPKTKQYLKDLIPQIREAKPYSNSLSRNFRLNHVAYCLLRGKKYEDIEQPRPENEISEYIINEYKKIILKREGLDETLCNSL